MEDGSQVSACGGIFRSPGCAPAAMGSKDAQASKSHHLLLSKEVVEGGVSLTGGPIPDDIAVVLEVVSSLRLQPRWAFVARIEDTPLRYPG